MTSRSQWIKIEAALDEILALPESQWREASTRLAGSDAELLSEIESLLACTQGKDPILDQPLAAAGNAAFEIRELRPGTRIGAFRIVALIGRGGMGEVYRADRADGVYEQHVALKVMQHEAADHIERFQAERQILARLEHPGIARLIDGGLAPDGRPFMAMEFVDGRSIVEWCHEKHCDLATRLKLFMSICDAVAYAHRNLVVHRDLKPANVFACGTGEVKLLDFGVAKLVDARRDVLTQHVPLTPSYAAPEQLTHAAVTTSTDIYALGLILFELLTGEGPWPLSDMPLMVGLEKVLHEDPPFASDVAQRVVDPPVPVSSLRGDLDAILAKTLRKVPEHRYESVSALQADIQRSLSHQPVTARAGARLYRFDRFVRRNRALLSSALLIFVTVIAGLIGTLSQAQRARHEAAQARQAQLRLLTQVAAIRLNEGNPISANRIILEVLERRASEAADAAAAVGVFQEIRAATAQLAVLSGHEAWVMQAVYSPDGSRILTASRDGTARQWDARTGILLSVLSGHQDSVMSAVYSPDGARIATGSADHTIRIWDADTGSPRLMLPGHTDWVQSVAYSPDGTRLVSASRDKTWRLWDANNGKALGTFEGHRDSVRCAAFSPDGMRIVTASNDRTARVWDAQRHNLLMILSGHDSNVQFAAFSPDGQHILTTSADATARIWDAHDGKVSAVLAAHTDVVQSAAYSSDGKRLVTASADKTARLWDARTGTALALLAGHGDIVLSAAFSPDGRRVVTASADKLAMIWDAQRGEPNAVVTGFNDSIWSASYAPNGDRFVTASYDDTARISDAVTGNTVAVLSGHTLPVRNAAFSPDGTRIVTASIDKTARIWDAISGQVLAVLVGHGDSVESATFSSDGTRVVTGSYDKTARVWDSRTGAMIHVLSHGGVVESVAFSPDDKHVLTGSDDKTARLWDATTGLPTATLWHDDVVESAVYSADGTRILTASDDRSARVWDARNGQELVRLQGHRDSVNSAAYSPDGLFIATASDDKTARIWDAQTGVELGILGSHPQHALSARFSPDGNAVMTAAMDRVVRMWDSRVPAPLAAQITWSRAAQFDPLTDAERSQLGLWPRADFKPWPAGATECDRAAGSFYDPDRVATGVDQTSIAPEVAGPACAGSSNKLHSTPRLVYESGRASLAKSDRPGARRQFEEAVAQGYRAARIDLADLILANSPDQADARRAMSLYERAWQEHVTVAAFKMGRLYELGIAGRKSEADLIQKDAAQSVLWYQRGHESREPNTLARSAQHAEQRALAESVPDRQDAMLLEAFGAYAEAADQAGAEGWPDEAWKDWRYRRANLARLLARDGLMQRVADRFAESRAR